MENLRRASNTKVIKSQAFATNPMTSQTGSLRLPPALTPAGACTWIPVADIAEGHLRELQLHPDRALLPTEQWPDSFESRKVFCDDAEWLRITRHLFSIGLIQFCHESEIRWLGNKPLLSGAFGVSKRGTTLPPPDGRNILRLVFNLIPPAPFKVSSVEIYGPFIPYAVQWSGIQLLEGDMVMLWSEEDLVSCFYLFRLPDSWKPLNILGLLVRGMGISDLAPQFAQEERAYISVVAMGMGWLSACGLLQHFHRKLSYFPRSVAAFLSRPLSPARRSTLMACPPGRPNTSMH